MRTRTTKIAWGILALMAVGAAVRVALLFSIPFNTPFHLGGLFYEFSRQILQNHFALPAIIPYYSLGGIPFAYPPLSFYLQAVVMKLFSPPPFVTVNLLPPLIAVFSLPAFFWMIKAQTDDNRLQAAALFAFALMPSAFANQIEGAGLAEACGTVVLLLYLGWLFRFERDPHPAPALWAGLFLGLCVLSSPGSAYGCVILSVLFFLQAPHSESKKPHLQKFRVAAAHRTDRSARLRALLADDRSTPRARRLYHHLPVSAGCVGLRQPDQIHDHLQARRPDHVCGR